MGVVYVAEDLLLGRRVAVKFPTAGRDEKHFRARFRREARAVSQLSHRNVAAVYDYGEDEEGRPFIVMELVTGQTLGDIMRGTGLGLARAVEIMRDVAAALSEAHRRGIVHRDVKPSNVMISDAGEVKVLDFGLAKQFEEGGVPSASSHTRSGVVIGTPLYLSPEQARGQEVDGRSDLFALGALLYECVAGRPAFSGANVIEIGAQVLHVDPPPPSVLNPRVPPELDEVTLKALAKDPTKRYQTAGEFIADLEAVRELLSGQDATRTRRLSTRSSGLRSSTLITELRRPRLSPLTLAAAVALALLCVWGYAKWRRPSAHVPAHAAVEAYRRGVDAMREGSYHEASAELQRAVEADGRFALARARLAEAWAELDFLDRAKDELLVVATLVPDRTVLSPLEALYLEAVTATVRREYAEATRAYEEIARHDGNSAQVHLDLGRAYEKHDKIEQAIASYAKATELDPRYAAAFLRLGTLYGRRQNLVGAAAAFERAEKLYAESNNVEGRAEVFYQRGFLYNNDLPRARRELQQALDLARASDNGPQQVLALLQLALVAAGESNNEQALAHAQEAVRLAEAGSAHNLTARAYASLATTYYQAGNFSEAERHFNRALDFSRAHGLPRFEAMALANMGSMRLKQERVEEGFHLLEQARAFYQQGGYAREVGVTLMLIGRNKRQRGDYDGAVRTFSEQLERAEKSGDAQQIGNLHREIAAVLSIQEKYVEALDHYRESIAIFKSLGNQLFTAYALLGQAGAQIRLGRYDDARESLNQVFAVANRPESSNKELLARISAMQAFAELTRLRTAEAAAESRKALELGGQYKDLVADAKRTFCLARARSGAHAEARIACEEALRLAGETKDPVMVALNRSALGEALLAGGDARRALEELLAAREVFALSGKEDSEWRSLALAVRASRRLGDGEKAREYAASAVVLLERVGQRLGTEATATYLSRPDLQELRKELDPPTSLTPRAAR